MLRKPKVVREFVEPLWRRHSPFSDTEWDTIRKHNSESRATMGFSTAHEETLTNLPCAGRGDELCNI